MAEPADPNTPSKRFLDATDAEVVDGPAVIAGKLSGALRDADRFGMPHVKPPVSDALNKVRRSGASAEAPGDEPAEQNALSGVAAEVDDRAGSAEVLKPAEKADPA